MSDGQERIGQSIGDYRLLRLLGRGTFGTVYQAEHIHDHTSAALKVLHFPLTGRTALRTFLNEARTMRLRHPHIVPILDFGLSRNDLPYLVMAYAGGGTLRDRYPQGSKLPHEIIDTYVQQLASALQYAHDHRIVHRDVKPENMLVHNDGTVQLSDFGLARISELASLSSLHRGAGTPAYAAPEQSRGKPCPASDQYALAVVVYEWLAGQRPFKGAPLAVMMNHHKDAPPSLRSICPEVSLLVEQVIFKALAKTPEDRFPTVTHFAEALHAALQDAISTQPLSNRATLQSVPSPIDHIPLPDTQPPTINPSGVPLAAAETVLSPQSDPLPLSDVDASASELAEVLQSSRPASAIQKQSPMDHRYKLPALLLCLALLLSGGATTWLVMAQQQQARTAHSATATAVSLATTAAKAYWTGTAKNGVQFGFDAAHTRWNPYEQVLNAANVTHITQLWSFTIGDQITSTVTVANGMAYVSAEDHKLYVFDATCRSNCQPLWSFLTEGGIHSIPAVANGMVYVGSKDKKLYVFDATCRSGCQPLWSFATGDSISSSPGVANGMVYVGSYDKKLYVFDATCRSGCQPLWSFATGDSIFSSPAVANGIVYVGSGDKKLYAFDATCRSNCSPLWSFTTGDWVTSSPAVANGIVYVGSKDGKFYAFDATCRRSCQPLWSFATGDSIFSSPAVANGIVYVGSDDGKFYAFDATCRSNCQPLWSFPTRNTIGYSPLVANGVVYISSFDGKLYAFDTTCRSNCQPLWSFQIGSSILSSPTVANGVIYTGSSDHKLYALGLPT